IVLAALVLPWWVTEAWVPVTGVPELDPVTLWDATWPILLGLVPAALVWWRVRSGRSWREPAPLVPAGDLVVPAEHAVAGAGDVLRRAGQGLGAARDRAVEGLASGWAAARRRGG